jgi:hypothetical protein
MDQFIPFHKPNIKSEEWEDDGPPHSSKQTHHYRINFYLNFYLSSYKCEIGLLYVNFEKLWNVKFQAK